MDEAVFNSWFAKEVNIEMGSFVIYNRFCTNGEGHDADVKDTGIVISYELEMELDEIEDDYPLAHLLHFRVIKTGKANGTAVLDRQIFSVRPHWISVIKDIKPLELHEIKKLIHKHPYTHIFT
jgi:hypothetical protein